MQGIAAKSIPRAVCWSLRSFPAAHKSLLCLPRSHTFQPLGLNRLPQLTHHMTNSSQTASKAMHVQASQGGGFATVSVQEAAKMLEEGWSYIDVRTPDEFANGHPPGAVNIPVTQPDSRGMMTINQEFVIKVEEAFPDRDTNLLMGCKVGQRSAMASQMLQNQEYINLANVAGGFDHWLGHGLPVEQ